MLYTRFLQLISKSIAKALSVGFFLLFTFISSGTAHALSTDRDQPAEIEADDIEFDFKNGTRTYINNVLVIQGTLRVKADKVIANYGEEDLENATAWGSLARFKQRPDGKTEDTEGWAKKIIVDQVKNTITLIGKAALKQGPNTARGDTIVYNMATDKMRISGGSKIQAAGKNGEAMPKRTEDPFAEKAPATPSAPAATAKTTATTNAATAAAAGTATGDGTAATATTEAAPETPVATEPPPVKAGRSRLILQPK